MHGWQGKGGKVTNSETLTLIYSNGGKGDYQRFHNGNHLISESGEGMWRNSHVAVCYRENIAFFNTEILQCVCRDWEIEGSCDDKERGVAKLSWGSWVKDGRWK